MNKGLEQIILRINFIAVDDNTTGKGGSVVFDKGTRF